MFLCFSNKKLSYLKKWFGKCTFYIKKRLKAEGRQEMVLQSLFIEIAGQENKKGE